MNVADYDHIEPLSLRGITGFLLIYRLIEVQRQRPLRPPRAMGFKLGSI
ncbi:MAG: hypothetical protein GF311_10200 [Candidatus Lokiarchaeota archaeon]|nr:hypothetical protein [Candidatus Lokiarchaeota archaeon]